MSPVAAADPRAVELETAFAEAMQQPGPPRPDVQPKAPEDVDKEAPFGRDDHGNPIAPHGYTKEGKVRRSAAGRPRNDDSRTTTKPAAESSQQKPALEPKDYVAGLSETSEAVWVGLTVCASIPFARIPVIGQLPIGKNRKLGSVLEGMSDRIAAQAHIFNSNRGALVSALNIAANNNPRARRLAEKLESGDATWVLVCVSMMQPFVSQSAALWSGTLEQEELPPVPKLRDANRANFTAWTERLNEQMRAAAEAAAAGMEQAA